MNSKKQVDLELLGQVLGELIALTRLSGRFGLAVHFVATKLNLDGWDKTAFTNAATIAHDRKHRELYPKAR